MFVNADALLLAVRDAFITRQNRCEVRHGVPRNQLGVALYRIKVMQIWMAFKRLVSCGFLKAFITSDDPFGDLVLFDEGLIGSGTQHVSGEALGTDRLHRFQIKRKEKRNISCSLGLGLSGKIGERVHF